MSRKQHYFVPRLESWRETPHISRHFIINPTHAQVYTCNTYRIGGLGERERLVLAAYFSRRPVQRVVDQSQARVLLEEKTREPARDLLAAVAGGYSLAPDGGTEAAAQARQVDRDWHHARRLEGQHRAGHARGYLEW